MKRIIIIRGPAGIGKSTIGRLVKKKLGDSLFFNIDLVCSDMIGGNSRKKEDRFAAHELCFMAAKKTPKNNLIFEWVFYSQKEIDHVIKLFSKLKYKIQIITLMAPLTRLIRQDSERKKTLGPEIIKKLYSYILVSDVKNQGKIIEMRNRNAETVSNEIIKYLRRGMKEK